ncbi:murein transglycosylase A [Altererythrobacter sp. GH1-8]|uniref:murein transglycosylase A n=1 Tax=Altererythrobacter sp. GH1-8 TaxID=3349333 RepID=UPI00374D7A6F
MPASTAKERRVWVQRCLIGLAGIGLLSACVRLVPDALPPQAAIPTAPEQPAPVYENAAAAGVRRGPSVGALPLKDSDASTALVGFLDSCPQLLRREDASRMTYGADWQQACEAAANWPLDDARTFFIKHFETARVGDGRGFATGYFEPEIVGCRTPAPGCDTPVYAMPPDLLRDPNWSGEGRAPLGRYGADGEFVPYYERSEIVAGALQGKAPILAYAADPVEFFFLQIQGSGRLKTPEGEIIRIGYAGQNGRGYTAIGAVMRERGLIGDGTPYPISMQGIVAWLRDHPAQADAIMNTNQSWIFFRELTGDGPLGALGIPVRRETSVAADPRFVPLGAPVWLDFDRDEADGLWVAHDTGGAIKGANRFDTFWGAGEDARAIAGGMSARGQALLLVPKGTVGRLNARYGEPPEPFNAPDVP